MKHEVLNRELNYIKDERIRKSCEIILDLLPDYFFSIPASSTGKYHPEFSLGERGLIRHVKAAVKIAKDLLDNPCIGGKYTDDEKDLRHNAMQYFMTVQNKLNLLSGKARQSNAIQTDTPSQATVNRIKILDELVNAGQLKYENGTYSITARHMKDFCQWLMQNGYEDITPSLIHEKITPKIFHQNFIFGIKYDSFLAAL